MSVTLRDQGGQHRRTLGRTGGRTNTIIIKVSQITDNFPAVTLIIEDINLPIWHTSRDGVVLFVPGQQCRDWRVLEVGWLQMY